MAEHLDVIVVGAGISGIGAGYHLQTKCPSRSYAILESRERLGGTWDLFRYPGVRSDSDMFTLGYAFRPWKGARGIATGESILTYLRETAEAYGIDEKIRYRHRVRRIAWSSSDARWTVDVEHGETGETKQLTCSFLYMCSGYYSYERGYTPEFLGRERFAGRIVHPQAWPEDLDYAGRRVVVIGSGATAMTLVPEMSKTAAHVTMLQRSPTYVISRPAEDPFAQRVGRYLPERTTYSLTRWKSVLLGAWFYGLSKRRPEKVKAWLVSQVREALGPDYDVRTHFTPRYAPWDQRICLVPDGDLFEALKAGKASVVTDRIKTFTEGGILLESGQELEADIIVTATGLDIQFLGKVEVEIDGHPVVLADALTYKAMMLSDVPNLAFAVGYTNASWTLKCELTSDYVCRLLNHMERHGYSSCCPRVVDPTVEPEPSMDFSSGYVVRKIHEFPKRGSKAPWRLRQSYLSDVMNLRLGRVDDPSMEFS